MRRDACVIREDLTMPFLVENAEPGAVVAVAAAGPGWKVDAFVTRTTLITDIPAPGSVVAWATVADPASTGGVRIDPVFLADGQMWTPDQFRAAFGDTITLRVTGA
ncbi:hypothetical protein GPZ77_34680 (plasmid) [Streptomyces sp. QHH-9511]|uniref:hypothetical protein n=1 Tax=Streptomyces sp. QHH-9511 TaxID=2684468 RepID=UPI00131600B6|nr:hypothetical protein [Streptomyces sp. QHH-9511]QGZ53374.1 hypothetical protein GPZ77_34680 [Streptomyces sp. QHH-9511]